MNKFINMSLLANPLNWMTVGTMIVLTLVAGFVIYSRLTASASEAPTASKLAKEA